MTSRQWQRRQVRPSDTTYQTVQVTRRRIILWRDKNIVLQIDKRFAIKRL